MKVYIALATLLVVTFVNGQERGPPHHISPEHAQFFYECRKEVESKKDSGNGDSHLQRACVKACFMKKTGVVKPDGTYDVEKIISNMKKDHEGQERGFLIELEAAIQACALEANAVVTTDECERAGAMGKCMYANFKKNHH